jgi:hypothetical protein
MKFVDSEYGVVEYVREGPPSATKRVIVVRTKGLGLIMLDFAELTPYVE